MLTNVHFILFFKLFSQVIKVDLKLGRQFILEALFVIFVKVLSLPALATTAHTTLNLKESLTINKMICIIIGCFRDGEKFLLIV